MSCIHNQAICRQPASNGLMFWPIWQVARLAPASDKFDRELGEAVVRQLAAIVVSLLRSQQWNVLAKYHLHITAHMVNKVYHNIFK
jgi:hypothetical protein